MSSINNLKIDIFADISTLQDIENFSAFSHIKGFTTNPSLLKKAGIISYDNFIKEAASLAGHKSISFEVISDTDKEIINDAKKIASCGDNIYVKIPYFKTNGEDNCAIIKELTDLGIKINVTALFTVEQSKKVFEHVSNDAHIIFSVFAGRIADTGIDPSLIINQIVGLTDKSPHMKVLWASCREVFNIIQAENVACDIITLTPNFLQKLNLLGADLNEYARQTSEMFFKDAQSAGFTLEKINDFQWQEAS